MRRARPAPRAQPIPRLGVDEKSSRKRRRYLTVVNNKLKQYFKEGRGLRTETTFANTKDFRVNEGIG